MVRIQFKNSDNFNVTDIGIVSIDEFKKQISGFNVTDALLFMQRLSVELESFAQKKVHLMNSAKWFLITTEANAFIIKYIITNSSDLFLKPFTSSDHAKITVFYNHLLSDLNFVDINQEDSYKCMIRMIYSQSRYMRHPSHLLSRYLIFFNKLQTENAIQINAMLENALKLNFKEIANICFCVTGSLLSNKAFDVKNLVDHTITSNAIIECLTKEKIFNYIDLFCIDLNTFREKCNLLIENRDLEKYSYNPLWKFPIIKTRNIFERGKTHIIPSIPDLIYASTEGVYYCLMDYYRKEKANPFSEKFGYLFEDYIEFLLKEASFSNYLRETERDIPRSVVPDFLLKHSDFEVHIECKKRKMSLDSKACIGNKFEKYIEEIAESIYSQLYRKRTDTSINFIVAMDEWYQFDEKVKGKIESNIKAKHQDYDSNFRFHMLGILDFEMFIQFSIDNGIGKSLEALKEKDENAYYESLSAFFERQYNVKYSTLDYFDKIYEDFFSQLKG